MHCTHMENSVRGKKDRQRQIKWQTKTYSPDRWTKRENQKDGHVDRHINKRQKAIWTTERETEQDYGQRGTGN